MIEKNVGCGAIINENAEVLVEVFVGSNSRGHPVFESLPVRYAGAERGYRLLRSPLMALGVARNDTFWMDDGKCIVQVNKAGEFHALQLVAADRIDDESVQHIAASAHEVGGELDALDEPVIAISLPFSFDPAQVESFVDSIDSRVKLEDWWVSSEAELIPRD